MGEAVLMHSIIYLPPPPSTVSTDQHSLLHSAIISYFLIRKAKILQQQNCKTLKNKIKIKIK